MSKIWRVGLRRPKAQPALTVESVRTQSGRAFSGDRYFSRA
ncbi:MAG: hypothetical protein QOE49_5775 [Rhodospirillaceae bacterium]|jgi:hypothetical protein|nr:hypothetical protein [Rhodospirillaceae bacterium]